jgi:hypothetical protein
MFAFYLFTDPRYTDLVAIPAKFLQRSLHVAYGLGQAKKGIFSIWNDCQEYFIALDLMTITDKKKFVLSIIVLRICKG